MGVFAKHNFKLSVHFENNDRRVVPGSPARGEVEVVVKSKTKITAIRIKFVGMEEAELTTWETPGTAAREKKKKTSTESKKQKVFEQSITLFGFADASGRRGGAELEAGTFTYPFELTLPGNTAPSMYFCARAQGDGDDAKQASVTACISYTATASAVIPYGFDAQTTISFTVASVMPSRAVQHQQQHPTSFTAARELLTPDWSGWRGSLSRCCSSWRGCVESIAGPFPHVVLQIDVWNAATAVQASSRPARVGTASPLLPQADAVQGQTGSVELPMMQDVRANGDFSPVSPGDIVLAARGIGGDDRLTGIPVESTAAHPVAELITPGDGLAYAPGAYVAAAVPQPQPPERHTQRPVPAPPLRTPPSPTPQYYRTLFALTPNVSSPHSLLVDLTIENRLSSTDVKTLHIKLVQVQKITVGSFSTARIVPIFECDVFTARHQASERVPLQSPKLRPGETSTKVTVQIPLPAILVETSDEHGALAPTSGTGGGPWFLPTVTTSYMKVYTLLTVDAPELTFGGTGDESRLLLLSNAVKMAALEDASNTATGIFRKALVLSEVALGADKL